MKYSLILLSLVILAVLIIFAVFFSKFNLTGSFIKSMQNENITEEIYNEEESITTEKTLQCPVSCDDYNPCTVDWCNKTSNFSCDNTNLTGDFEGCKSIVNECSKRTCVSGKCMTVKTGNCLKETRMEEVTQPNTETQETTQSEEQQEEVQEEPIINEPQTSETQENVTEPITALDHVIINEILTKSPLCGEKEGFEFIELYNPTSSPVSIGSWWIIYYASTRNDWGDYTWRKELPSDVQIDSDSYYLIAVSTYWDNCTEKPDWVISSDYNLGYSAQDGKITASKGTISLHSSFGTVVDAVGWGSTSLYEGSPTTIESGKSLQRKSFKIDTNNNIDDFTVVNVQNPQNSQFK